MRVSGQCAHVLAVVKALEQWKISGYKEIPAEPSSTSLPQQWDKPRGEKIKAQPVSKMIISRPTNLNRKRKPVIASYIDTRKMDINIDDIEKLKILKQSPISYLVTSTADCTVDTPLGVQFIDSALSYHAPLIQPIANPRAAWSCGDTEFPKALAPCDLQSVEQLAHEWSNLDITQSDANELERSTRLQSSDPRWYTERSKRITASNFGLIMRRKKDINETFMKNTFKKKSFHPHLHPMGKRMKLLQSKCTSEIQEIIFMKLV